MNNALSYPESEAKPVKELQNIAMKRTALAREKPLAKWSSVSMALGRSNQQSSCEKQGTIGHRCCQYLPTTPHTSQRNLWQLCWIVWRVGWNLAITPNQFHLKRCRWIIAVFGLVLVFQCTEFGPLMAAQFSRSLMTINEWPKFFLASTLLFCHPIAMRGFKQLK